ncbi:glycerate kinase type-2 family protein [Natronolimnohabitans innermongolicus]|uniref:Hydroxypyruvate reductase n=1 Tax=Natronolimnohabitans innermongolicus JCM 12255 TaxID=1227499 RepID=L9XBC1_9EURY|nr:DUF4147 domain-containing protein [Natronolimnohabitans innermongolicus]ELY59019.1 hydroxypyruvate reductase [Natronolimnohabitans innermongolicus JCM 12255]
MFDRDTRHGGSRERGTRAVLDALEAGITAAHPDTVLSDAIDLEGSTLRIAVDEYDLDSYESVVVLGGGNAAGRIASHLADRLGERLAGGVVVTDDPAPAGPVDVIEGTHPTPSEPNVDGARRVLERARACDDETLVLAPVTGGGSALLTAPVEGVDLDDVRTLTDELLRSGAPIDRINAVRKHVSALKGGQLARELAPATTVGLVFSDVTSNDPSVVASGPLSPDPTTYEDALEVLATYEIDAPAAVTRQLRAGVEGTVAETPGPNDPALESASVTILADNATALTAAAAVCERAGFEPLLLSSSIRGEARAAATTHVAIAEEIRRSGRPVSPPAAIVSGGETTVTVTGDGTGGPNQEFALGAALELPAETVLGAVDTDGIDGPTDAAGAVVTPDVVDDERRARAMLADNDAYPYLDERGALVRSGATGTNVNDLRVLLVPATDDHSRS